MQVFSICAKKEFQQNGETKTKYYKVSFLKINDKGKRYITLYQQPYVEYCVFDEDENLPVIY